MGHFGIPAQDARSAVTQNGDSDASSTGSASTTEAAFSNTATAMAENMQDTAGDMGDRNDQIRGIEMKEESYATLEIAEGNKNKTSQGAKYAEFLLQSANEVSQEKYQLVETFGDTVAFFFGTRPKIYQYSGVLLNTADYPWRDDWKNNYEETFRGTRCVENKKRAYLTYDYVLREGYILGMNIGQISASPNNVDFNFTMFITREINLSPSSGGMENEAGANAQGESDQAMMDENNLNMEKNGLDLAGEEAVAKAGTAVSQPTGGPGGNARGGRDT